MGLKVVRLQTFWMKVLLMLVSATAGFIWYILQFSSNDRIDGSFPPHAKDTGPAAFMTCQHCRSNTAENMMKVYSEGWRKQEVNIRELRSQLNSKCNGVSKAIVTQANSLLGSTITYDGEKISARVTATLFDTFVKESPFVNKTFETCAVVGNGGILTNSSCGGEIDDTQFVIRCNLPPVNKGYTRDVGTKTNLVTSNPSILLDKFGALGEHRRPFVDMLEDFGDSLLLLPAFSYGQNTAVSLRALYTVQDFRSLAQPVFLNPEYLRNLAQFWQEKGLQKRLSTGIMMASLALELCHEVHLYGFWPFPQHPCDCRSLTNHYYDNRQAKKNVHAMPDEFGHLLQLHSLGVIKLHLGECQSKSKQSRLSFFLR